MSEATGMTLNDYFARIGYRGEPAPDLGTLRALHALHPAAIPFEAIDVLLGRGIDLLPAAVDAKLVAARRGGYCFEQNGLFRRVLTAIGFEVEGLAARVVWNHPPDGPTPPYNHMVLRVTVDGQPWLADVGFGARVLTRPLALDATGTQATEHDRYRLRPERRNLMLELADDDAWLPLYELSPEPCVDADYEQANWYTSTHPDSRFRQHLIVARTTPEARYALLDDRFTVRWQDGRVERELLGADAMERVLGEMFLLPVTAAWRDVIERAAATTADDDRIAS